MFSNSLLERYYELVVVQYNLRIARACTNRIHESCNVTNVVVIVQLATKTRRNDAAVKRANLECMWCV
jgi:hypothetical protein